MGKLTALQIRNLKEPGRYSDGDGLTLVFKGPQKGNWILRTTVAGRRRDIGLGSLLLVSLKEAREIALEMRRDILRGIDPVAERQKRVIKVLTFLRPPALCMLSSAQDGKMASIRTNGLQHRNSMPSPSLASALSMTFKGR